jgi:hypothetical protein
MEGDDFHRATQDDELQEAADEGDPLAAALLAIAEMHRDAAISNMAGAITSANEARAWLEDDVEEGFQRKALLQHIDQCKEYLRKGKPLPDLPSGL